jgi:hypothetical protein
MGCRAVRDDNKIDFLEWHIDVFDQGHSKTVEAAFGRDVQIADVDTQPGRAFVPDNVCATNQRAQRRIRGGETLISAATVCRFINYLYKIAHGDFGQ